MSAAKSGELFPDAPAQDAPASARTVYLARQYARGYAERVRRHPHPCKHGHFDCADRERGECLDELFSLLELDNDGEPLS